MGRRTSPTNTRRKAPKAVPDASRSKVVHAVRSMAGSVLSSAASVFERAGYFCSDPKPTDGEFEDLQSELQEAVRSRATAILQHYKEIAEPARSVQAEECLLKDLTELSSAIRQLTEAELNRGRLLRNLRGDLESLAAELRVQVTNAATAAAKARGGRVASAAPKTIGIASRPRTRTLRD
ncbi:unnamed protein product [Symbiodinium necroappetens]|uniref:Uncharacterized protein n=1 Tax=Symbiodinium necroappetens TaxID=1628268 RepID=A0A812KZE7_9DINO|nr:unnamed protein product [Symbiodinium necroappetens]